MSTGDQTQYMRGKLAERGTTREASFMRDGFDNWAESETPARVGQIEKIPAESQMQSYGGAMSLKHAKQFQVHGGMHGGFIELPSLVKDGIAAARKLIDFYKGASEWLDDFREELQDEVIDNPDPKLVQWRPFAQDLKNHLDALKPFQTVLDAIIKVTGAGRRGMHGGMSLEQAGQVAQQIIDTYMWFNTNAAAIRAILGGFRSLNTPIPVGKEILKVLDPILSAVGMGKGGKKCGCKKGGAVDKIPPFPKMGGRSCGGALEVLPSLDSLTKSGGRKRAASVEMPEYETYGAAMPRPVEYNMAPPRYTQEEEDAIIRKKMGGRKVGGRAPSARGAIVRKVMAEHGLSLPQASKYVKEHGLY